MSTWQIIMPVKYVEPAKSRLGPPSESHRRLTMALAIDTIAAARFCPSVARVIVVHGVSSAKHSSPPQDLSAIAIGTGARADDHGHDTPAELLLYSQIRPGLNGAIADGISIVSESTPQAPCAVLLADIPSLQPDSLRDALRAAESILGPPAGLSAPQSATDRHNIDPFHEEIETGSAFVPDRSGTGTVLLAGLNALALSPAFGADSAWAHAQGGAHRLDLNLPRLRTDVDSPEDLTHARVLGLGPATLMALQDWP